MASTLEIGPGETLSWPAREIQGCSRIEEVCPVVSEVLGIGLEILDECNSPENRSYRSHLPRDAKESRPKPGGAREITSPHRDRAGRYTQIASVKSPAQAELGRGTLVSPNERDSRATRPSGGSIWRRENRPPRLARCGAARTPADRSEAANSWLNSNWRPCGRSLREKEDGLKNRLPIRARTTSLL
jgi:hypothetical protein